MNSNLFHLIPLIYVGQFEFCYTPVNSSAHGRSELIILQLVFIIIPTGTKFCLIHKLRNKYSAYRINSEERSP